MDASHQHPTADAAALSSSAPRRRPSSYQPPNEFQWAHLDDLVKVKHPVGRENQAGLFGEGDEDRRQPLGETVFLAGERDLLKLRCVAIVGTRNVSPIGANRARRLAKELSAAGVVVVSGLAKGVDTAALTAALESGGKVVAVIGTPLGKAYPAENKRLQETIYREHLLVSPFPEGITVQKHFFPIRNRVMAALSDATVIIEASDTSGTLHQAVACTKLKRWLFIAKSVVDDPKLKWPKDFIGYEKTRVLTTTDDLLSVLPQLT